MKKFLQIVKQTLLVIGLIILVALIMGLGFYLDVLFLQLKLWLIGY